MDFPDIRLLADLLNISNEDENDQNFDDEQKVRPYSKKQDPSKRKIVKEENSERESSKTIPKNDDDDEKFYELSKPEDDWRKTPEWHLCYKQNVSPTDVFLQMSGKTQLTASCEEIIITINLPGEQSKNIDVKITADKLDLLTPQYRLSVPLPHPVDPQKGNEAKWYPEEEQLKLTLTMEREFDFLNF